jgi:hypothetical protein
MVLLPFLLLLHIVGIAAFLGGAFAQQQFMTTFPSSIHIVSRNGLAAEDWMAESSL